MKLYGKAWTRRELEARVGRVEQIGGVRRLQAAEGFEQGLQTVQVRTGGGLEYFVNPSRGLDISLCQFGGTPVSWQAPQGDVGPAFYSAHGTDWLRTACGGMLMTCGMRNAGVPCEDQGDTLGLHGRAHHTPARQVSAQGCWDGDEYVMQVSGQIEEARFFGEYLKLYRVIESRLGGHDIRIKDSVENCGFEPSPLMLLYHFNFGFPLLSEHAELDIKAQKTEPRDERAAESAHDRWEAPTAGFTEQCYYHSGFERDADGFAKASVMNSAFPVAGGITALKASVCWKPEQLDWLVQWTVCGQGMHVLGIEPANCRVNGRAGARAAGDLKYIAPGERQEFETVLRFEKKD
ncbi:MAG: aldose 1-epimerase family protein [Lentisphaerae bacterium]|nr:aldose 1-epimerase family protein [Lentisphaerota bacterium]